MFVTFQNRLSLFCFTPRLARCGGLKRGSFSNIWRIIRQLHLFPYFSSSSIHGKTVKQVSSLKYLGLIIHNKLPVISINSEHWLFTPPGVVALQMHTSAHLEVLFPLLFYIALTMANDTDRPLNQHFTFLLCATRHRPLKWARAQISRSFVPSVIAVMNKLRCWHCWARIVEGTWRLYVQYCLYAYGTVYTFFFYWLWKQISLKSKSKFSKILKSKNVLVEYQNIIRLGESRYQFKPSTGLYLWILWGLLGVCACTWVCVSHPQHVSAWPHLNMSSVVSKYSRLIHKALQQFV